MGDDIDKLVFWVAVLAIIGAVFAINWFVKRRRATAMAEAAGSIGFFHDEDDYANLPDMRLWSLGNGNNGHDNMLRGSAGGYEVLLFDYWYEKGSGRSRHDVAQTVTAFHLPGANMPDFHIDPRTWWRRLKTIFGSRGLIFEDCPAFTNSYVAGGADAISASTFFTPGILSFLAARTTDLTIEGYYDWIIIYRSGKKAAPAKLREFLDHTTEIASGILSQVPRPLARK